MIAAEHDEQGKMAMRLGAMLGVILSRGDFILLGFDMLAFIGIDRFTFRTCRLFDRNDRQFWSRGSQFGGSHVRS